MNAIRFEMLTKAIKRWGCRLDVDNHQTQMFGSNFRKPPDSTLFKFLQPDSSDIYTYHQKAVEFRLKSVSWYAWHSKKMSLIIGVFDTHLFWCWTVESYRLVKTAIGFLCSIRDQPASGLYSGYGTIWAEDITSDHHGFAVEIRDHIMHRYLTDALSSVFLAWKWRKDHLWNPHDPIGKRYLQRQAEKDCKDMSNI